MANLTVKQVYDLTAVTVLADTDIFYLTQSPYAVGDDAGFDGAAWKENVRDTVAAFAVAGTDMQIVHDDVNNTLTFNWIGTTPDIQDLLDDISTTAGAILYRGVSDWTALPPGSDEEVLTMGSGVPGWEPASAGGSGYTIIDAQVFTASGTWTKPAGAAYVRVIMTGGGGSGRKPANAAATGNGGTSAPIVETIFPADALGATVAVTVGAGGVAQTTANQNGNAGGFSAFGTFLESVGGLGGTTASLGPPFGSLAPAYLPPQVDASGRGANNAPGATQSGAGFDGAFGVCGGGGGGTGANSAAAGGAGGAAGRWRVQNAINSTNNGAAGGTAGGATGGNGATGTTGDIRTKLGGGGGGAGGGGTNTGGAGGAGGTPGGGGGAGGFGDTASGNSGAGGDGRVYVETWGVA